MKIILAFYLIGLLYNRLIDDYQEYQHTFLAAAAAFILLTLKTFWNLGASPFYRDDSARVFMTVVCTLLKVLALVAIAITLNNLSETSIQRNKFFYGEDYQPTPSAPIART